MSTFSTSNAPMGVCSCGHADCPICNPPRYFARWGEIDGNIALQKDLIDWLSTKQDDKTALRDAIIFNQNAKQESWPTYSATGVATNRYGNEPSQEGYNAGDLMTAGISLATTTAILQRGGKNFGGARPVTEVITSDQNEGAKTISGAFKKVNGRLDPIATATAVRTNINRIDGNIGYAPPSNSAYGTTIQTQIDYNRNTANTDRNNLTTAILFNQNRKQASWPEYSAAGRTDNRYSNEPSRDGYNSDDVMTAGIVLSNTTALNNEGGKNFGAARPVTEVITSDNDEAPRKIGSSWKRVNGRMDALATATAVRTNVNRIDTYVGYAPPADTTLGTTIQDQINKARTRITNVEAKQSANEAKNTEQDTYLAKLNRKIGEGTDAINDPASGGVNLQNQINTINTRTGINISDYTNLGSLQTQIKTNDGAVRQLVQDEKNRATAAETAITNNLTSLITAETNRATAAEAALNTNLTAAINTVNTNLSASINTVNTNLTAAINAEKTRAMAAESALDTKFTTRIDNEVATINNKITAETNRATAAETALSNRVTVLDDATTYTAGTAPNVVTIPKGKALRLELLTGINDLTYSTEGSLQNQITNNYNSDLATFKSTFAQRVDGVILDRNPGNITMVPVSFLPSGIDPTVLNKIIIGDLNGTTAVYVGINPSDSSQFQFQTLATSPLGAGVHNLIGVVDSKADLDALNTVAKIQAEFPELTLVPSVDDYIWVMTDESLNGAVVKYFITDIQPPTQAGIDPSTQVVTYGGYEIISTPGGQAPTTSAMAGRLLTGGAQPGIFGPSYGILHSVIEGADTSITTSAGVFSYVDPLVHMLNDRMTQIENDYLPEWTNVNNRITQEVADLNTRIDNEVATINADITQDIADLNARIDDEVAALNNRIDNEVATLDNKIDDAVTTLDNKIDDAVTTLNSTITNEITTLTNTMNAEFTTVNNNITQLQTDVTNLQTGKQAAADAATMDGKLLTGGATDGTWGVPITIVNSLDPTTGASPNDIATVGAITAAIYNEGIIQGATDDSMADKILIGGIVPGSFGTARDIIDQSTDIVTGEAGIPTAGAVAQALIDAPFQDQSLGSAIVNGVETGDAGKLMIGGLTAGTWGIPRAIATELDSSSADFDPDAIPAIGTLLNFADNRYIMEGGIGQHVELESITVNSLTVTEIYGDPNIDLSGDLNVTGKVTSGVDQTVTAPADQDLVTKKYTDATYVNTAGDTMTGTLIGGVRPSSHIQAVSGGYGALSVPIYYSDGGSGNFAQSIVNWRTRDGDGYSLNVYGPANPYPESGIYYATNDDITAGNNESTKPVISFNEGVAEVPTAPVGTNSNRIANTAYVDRIVQRTATLVIGIKGAHNACDYYVDPSTPGQDAASVINAAVQAIQNYGGEILIRAGSYSILNPIVLTRGIKLKGQNRSTDLLLASSLVSTSGITLIQCRNTGLTGSDPIVLDDLNITSSDATVPFATDRSLFLLGYGSSSSSDEYTLIQILNCRISYGAGTMFRYHSMIPGAAPPSTVGSRIILKVLNSELNIGSLSAPVTTTPVHGSPALISVYTQVTNSTNHLILSNSTITRSSTSFPMYFMLNPSYMSPVTFKAIITNNLEWNSHIADFVGSAVSVGSYPLPANVTGVIAMGNNT